MARIRLKGLQELIAERGAEKIYVVIIHVAE